MEEKKTFISYKFGNGIKKMNTNLTERDEKVIVFNNYLYELRREKEERLIYTYTVKCKSFCLQYFNYLLAKKYDE